MPSGICSSVLLSFVQSKKVWLRRRQVGIYGMPMRANRESTVSFLFSSEQLLNVRTVIPNNCGEDIAMLFENWNTDDPLYCIWDIGSHDEGVLHPPNRQDALIIPPFTPVCFFEIFSLTTEQTAKIQCLGAPSYILTCYTDCSYLQVCSFRKLAPDTRMEPEHNFTGPGYGQS